MKPDPSGFLKIAARLGIDPGSCLVIGDREDKDGAFAANVGARALILPESKKKRRSVYDRMENCFGKQAGFF